ncbi:unnamed protein product [Sphagnum jensenii]|uniref:Uncharacterized protein n=1 Tax=Sphagnum jensenii TaxID=128206 RepID=A0ABP1ARQ2_9BRYO
MPCLQQTVPRARPAALPRARCIESKAAPRVHGIGQKLIVEELSPEFFLAPLQWLASQANAQYPDFKPKKTGKGLWLNNKLNLPWVEARWLHCHQELACTVLMECGDCHSRSHLPALPAAAEILTKWGYVLLFNVWWCRWQGIS